MSLTAIISCVFIAIVVCWSLANLPMDAVSGAGHNQLLLRSDWTNLNAYQLRYYWLKLSTSAMTTCALLFTLEDLSQNPENGILVANL